MTETADRPTASSITDDQLEELYAERDQLLAELDGRGEEARERWIVKQLAETGLKAMDFRAGMAMEIEPAREMVAHWVGAARAMLGDAPNYTETPIEMGVKVGESPERFAFVLQRVAPGSLTPHQARRLAEEQRDGAYRERAQLLAWLAVIVPAVVAPAPDVDEPDWQILYLAPRRTQLSWHIAPADADLFQHVEHVDRDDPRAQWDGHTTEEKYQRIRTLALRGEPEPARHDGHKVAYDAVYAYIHSIGDRMPLSPVHRNALIWRGVHAALEATAGTERHEQLAAAQHVINTYDRKTHVEPDGTEIHEWTRKAPAVEDGDR